MKSFYENANASVWLNRVLSERFSVKVGVIQECVTSPWLFNISMDGCTRIREMKVGVQDLGARRNVRGVEQFMVVGLYADDTAVG